MKKIFIILLSILCSIEMNAAIYSGTCGDFIDWSLNTTTGKLTLSGYGGDMDTYYSKTDVPWHQYRSYIKTVVCDDDITSIGNYAFMSCSKLTTINIPENCITIGISAFESCTALTSVTLTSECTTIGDYAFAGCSSLALVTMAEGLEKIGEGAFFQCTHSYFRTMNLPQSVEEIGEYAFALCTNLKTVTIGNQLYQLPPFTFQLCQNLTTITLGNNILEIGEGCFDGCSKLQNVNNTNSVEYIQRDAFRACAALTSITFQNNLRVVNACAFQNCVNLASIEFGNRIDQLGDSAFWGCASLQTIRVANTSTQLIGDDCFYQVPKSAKIYVPSCTMNCYKTHYGWSYFSNFYANNSSSVNCTGIADCPDGGSNIGLSCADVIDIASNLSNNTRTAKIYMIYGYITSIASLGDMSDFFPKASFYISDTRFGSNSVYIENARWLDSNNVPPSVGDYVLIIGYISRSGSTYKVVDATANRTESPLPADGSTLTCAEAAEYASQLDHNSPTTQTYTIYGYVTSTDGVVSRNQQTFWIADAQNGGNVFEIYWGNVSQQLQVGDYVKCVGHLMRFYSTLEMKNPNVTLIRSNQSQTINYTPNWVEIRYYPQYGFHSLDMFVVDNNNATQQLLRILFYPSEQQKISGFYSTLTGSIEINPNIDGYYTAVNGTWYDLEAAAFFVVFKRKDADGNNIYQISGNCYLTDGREIDFTYENIVYPSTAIYENGEWTYTDYDLMDSLTPIENVNAESTSTKILRNGQIFIIRGDKTYTTDGRLVR